MTAGSAPETLVNSTPRVIFGFRGRKKSVIVTPAGLNIYPEDLESAVKKHPAIRDCVVVPLDRGGNAEPCAALLFNPPHSNDDAAARAAIESANAVLSEYQRMRSWIIWPEPDFRARLLASSALDDCRPRGPNSQWRPSVGSANEAPNSCATYSQGSHNPLRPRIISKRS